MWTRDRRRDSPRYDLVLRGGHVIDPAQGLDGVYDVGIRDGKIGAVRPAIEASEALHSLDVSDRLVVPGMIDTHAHVYQHVTGAFGMNPDLVGIRSGVTTVCDQGGARDTGRFTLEDSVGVQLTANERLRPEFALKDGRLHSSDSPLLFESTKGVASVSALRWARCHRSAAGHSYPSSRGTCSERPAPPRPGR